MLVFSKMIKLLVPQIFFTLYSKLRKAEEDPDVLFDGDDSLFKSVVRGALIYGEYGCGKSTNWVLNNTPLKVISVDTSREWVEGVLNDNWSTKERLNLHHANLGEVGDWGMPKSYQRQEFFSEYTDYLWLQVEKPSVVLSGFFQQLSRFQYGFPGK